MADLELGLAVAGLEESLADLRRAVDAQGRVGEAATRAGTQTRTAAEGATRAQRAAADSAGAMGSSVTTMASRVAGAANAVASLAGAIGNRPVQGAAHLVGSIASAVAQGAAMGSMFGPQGAVVGAVLGAVGAVAQLANAHRDAAEAAHEQREQVDLLRQALLAQRLEGDIEGALANPAQAAAVIGGVPEQTLIQQREIARANALARSADVAALEERLRTGRGGQSPEQLREDIAASQAQVQVQRDRIDLFDQEIERRHRDAQATEEQAGAQSRAAAAERERSIATRTQAQAAQSAQQAEAERARDAAEFARQLSEQATSGRSILHGGRYAGDGSNGIVGGSGNTIDVAAERLTTERAKYEEATTAAREHARAQREVAQTAADAAKAFDEGYVTSIDRVVDAWNRANVALRASGQGQLSSARLLERGMTAVGNSIADTVGNKMVGAFEGALGAWLDGSKSFVEAAEAMAKGVIKALVQEAIVQGVTELARGIADLASYHYDAAALHFAAAGAWAAVGGIAGAIGVGIGAFGGGGAEKSKGTGVGDTRDLAARSVSDRDTQQTIVVNVYSDFTQRGHEAFVMDGLNGAARSGRRIDARLLHGR